MTLHNEQRTMSSEELIGRSEMQSLSKMMKTGMRLAGHVLRQPKVTAEDAMGGSRNSW